MTSLFRTLLCKTVYKCQFQRLDLTLSMITCLILLSGCASTVRHTPVDYCVQPLNPSLAHMVMLRTNAMYGAAATIRIFDNDQPIGDIGPGDKLCWNRYPGISVIRGEIHGNRLPELIIEANTTANNTYYFRTGLGWTGRVMEHIDRPE